MLVKTESVDMTWERVLGSGGWGEGELVQRNRCEWIFPTKTEMPCFFVLFFPLLKSHFNLVKKKTSHPASSHSLRNAHTYIDKLENTQYSFLWYPRGDTQITCKEFVVIPGFLNVFPPLSPESRSRGKGTPFGPSSRNSIKSCKQVWILQKKLTWLHILWRHTKEPLPVGQHDTLLHCLWIPQKLVSEMSHPHVLIKCWIGKPCRRQVWSLRSPIDRTDQWWMKLYAVFTFHI